MVADALRDYNRATTELKAAADAKDELLAAHEAVRTLMRDVPEGDRTDEHAGILERYGKPSSLRESSLSGF